MHFQLWDEIPWVAVTDHDDVELLIAPVVMRELDKHKSLHPKRHLKQRAADRLSRLRKIIREESGSQLLRENVRIRILDEEPYGVDFSAERLSKDVADDWLIACAIQGERQNPDAKVCIVTDDNGLICKCFGRKLGVLSLKEEWRLPEVEDELEKEHRKVKRELEALKNLRPKLSISSKVRRTDPKYLDYLYSPTFGGNGTDEFREAQLFKYVAEQKQKLHWCIDLSNDGNCPARDIDLIIRVPDHVKLSIGYDSLPVGLSYLSAFVFREKPLWRQNDNGNISLPMSYSHFFKFHIQQIKHGTIEYLPIIFVGFESQENTANFQASYDLYCDNVTEPTKNCILNFILPGQSADG